MVTALDPTMKTNEQMDSFAMAYDFNKRIIGAGPIRLAMYSWSHVP